MNPQTHRPNSTQARLHKAGCTEPERAKGIKRVSENSTSGRGDVHWQGEIKLDEEEPADILIPNRECLTPPAIAAKSI